MIRVWEVATGKERCHFQEKGESNEWTGTQFLALSPDGRLLVSAGTSDPFARAEERRVTTRSRWSGSDDLFTRSARLSAERSPTAASLATPLASTARASPTARLHSSKTSSTSASQKSTFTGRRRGPRR